MHAYFEPCNFTFIAHQNFLLAHGVNIDYTQLFFRCQNDHTEILVGVSAWYNCLCYLHRSFGHVRE